MAMVSPNIPELAIAVLAAFRGQGIGHLLLEALMNLAGMQGIERISLSVEIDNPAINLYRRHGFVPLAKNGNSLTMVSRIVTGINSEQAQDLASME